ncbi:hypothetical protein C7447_10546 [Tenacibaculum adriaticum]|uniref:Uncharacterized protein n=1 Tax=Tenacibaculum adriaticum TaxID=413713 RepID=A0A5S5DM80_9FLAO|nr:hypothetical protein [Tenacibaculum adriaticum]TYP97033.1 hypothetical protein C7447_10546 [Tenacibaculum adriaticum]
MGENKHIEELDAFAKKYLKEIPTERPSVDFTANIMNTILADEKRVVFQNKSKLSNSIWFVLGGFIIASIYILFKGKSSEIKIPSFDFGSITLPDLPDYQMRHLLDNITFSSTTVYAFLIFIILFLVQGYFMKEYLTKRVS